MPDNLQFTEPKLLLVEGNDEVGFFTGFLNFLGIAGVQIVSYGGNKSLGVNLGAYVREPTFAQVQSLGIVQDADDNANSARQSIVSTLSNENLPEPPGSDAVRVSVFVMPDGANPGALEDLCLKALDDNSAMPCGEVFLQCVSAAGYSPPSHPAKARIRTLLASLEDSEARLGIRSQRSAGPPWDWNHPGLHLISPVSPKPLTTCL